MDTTAAHDGDRESRSHHLRSIKEPTMLDNLYDSALKQAAACARQRYAGEEKRIERGLLLALNHAVRCNPDGTMDVRSDRDREVYYQIRQGRCDCPDRLNAPDFRCKHWYAATFWTVATAALERVCTQTQ